MENAIDVECKNLTELEAKSIEQLAGEANVIWAQMEMIGNIGLSMAAQAGRRLAIIKSRLPHGQWESWCDENLNFSKSKAAKMMKLAEKTGDENSIFSNLETFPDLGISRVWALLSAPEEVTEQVINDPEVAEMTVRELKDKIRQLTAEKENKEMASQSKIEALEETISKLESEAKVASDSDEKEAAIAKLMAEKKELEKKLSSKKETLERLKSKQEASIEEAVNKAKEESRETIERLRREISNSENQTLAMFKLKTDLLQDSFNGCLNSISQTRIQNAEQAEKMQEALKRLMSMLIGRL